VALRGTASAGESWVEHSSRKVKEKWSMYDPKDRKNLRNGLSEREETTRCGGREASERGWERSLNNNTVTEIVGGEGKKGSRGTAPTDNGGGEMEAKDHFPDEGEKRRSSDLHLQRERIRRGAMDGLDAAKKDTLRGKGDILVKDKK